MIAPETIAARDGAHTLRVGQMIGGWFTYAGSDGQRHRGTVREVRESHPDFDGPVAVFSVGYSDGHWMPLERCARLMLARRIRDHYATVPRRCAAHDRYDDCEDAQLVS